jgi:DNA damage-inducible protein 1
MPMRIIQQVGLILVVCISGNATNPELVFAQVTMLYVPVLVNGHPVKAFVDSGAQTTLMSPSCAEKCGVSHLIDDRFSGIAHGIGTAKILGKVHQAKIQVGDAELDCAFTVMEGKEVDLLFGLDMLKRHQACIDLVNNTLRFSHTEVSFLPENEIPLNQRRRMLDEPTVQGPNGTEIGAKTGTVRPAGTAKAAHESLEKAKNPSVQAGSSDGQWSAAGESSTTGAQAASRFPENDIASLVGLGFSREEAVAALDKTDGNVEYAAGLLF